MRVSTSYTTFWALLALLSAGYLGVWATQPELLSRWRVTGGERLAHVDGDLRDEVQRLVQRVTELETRERSLAESLARLQPKVSMIPEPGPARVAILTPPVEPAKPEPVTLPAPTLTDTLRVGEALPRPTVRVLNAEAPPLVSVIETGALPKATDPAVPKAAAKAVPPPRQARPPVGVGPVEIKQGETKAPGPGAVGVQLGGGTTLDALRLNWSLMSEQNEDLRRLEPRYTTSDAQGTMPYRLQAGPLPTREDAVKICAELSARGLPCRVGAFNGSAL